MFIGIVDLFPTFLSDRLTKRSKTIWFDRESSSFLIIAPNDLKIFNNVDCHLNLDHKISQYIVETGILTLWRLLNLFRQTSKAAMLNDHGP